MKIKLFNKNTTGEMEQHIELKASKYVIGVIILYLTIRFIYCFVTETPASLSEVIILNVITLGQFIFTWKLRRDMVGNEDKKYAPPLLKLLLTGIVIIIISIYSVLFILPFIL